MGKEEKSWEQHFADAKKIMDQQAPKDQPRIEKDNTLGTRRSNESLSQVVSSQGNPGQAALPEKGQQTTTQTPSPSMQESKEKEIKYPYEGEAMSREEMIKKYGKDPMQTSQPPQPSKSQNAGPFVQDSSLENSNLPSFLKETFKEQPPLGGSVEQQSPTAPLTDDPNFKQKYKENLGYSPQSQPISEGKQGTMDKDEIKNIIRETIEEVKFEEEEDMDEGGIVKIKKGDYIYFAQIYKKAKAKKKK
jgi:hypothetical protein